MVGPYISTWVAVVAAASSRESILSTKAFVNYAYLCLDSTLVASSMYVKWEYSKQFVLATTRVG